VVMVIKLFPFLSQTLYQVIQAQGINWGVTIISVATVIPIATGQLQVKDWLNAMKMPPGSLAVVCGILVGIFSTHGVNLLSSTPQVAVALVIGTIIGVVFLKGVAAGPVIAAGITYYLVTLLNLSFS